MKKTKLDTQRLGTGARMALLILVLTLATVLAGCNFTPPEATPTPTAMCATPTPTLVDMRGNPLTPLPPTPTPDPRYTPIPTCAPTPTPTPVFHYVPPPAPTPILSNAAYTARTTAGGRTPMMITMSAKRETLESVRMTRWGWSVDWKGAGGAYTPYALYAAYSLERGVGRCEGCAAVIQADAYEQAQFSPLGTGTVLWAIRLDPTSALYYYDNAETFAPLPPITGTLTTEAEDRTPTPSLSASILFASLPSSFPSSVGAHYVVLTLRRTPYVFALDEWGVLHSTACYARETADDASNPAMCEGDEVLAQGVANFDVESDDDCLYLSVAKHWSGEVLRYCPNGDESSDWESIASSSGGRYQDTDLVIQRNVPSVTYPLDKDDPFIGQSYVLATFSAPPDGVSLTDEGSLEQFLRRCVLDVCCSSPVTLLYRRPQDTSFHEVSFTEQGIALLDATAFFVHKKGIAVFFSYRQALPKRSYIGGLSLVQLPLDDTGNASGYLPMLDWGGCYEESPWGGLPEIVCSPPPAINLSQKTTRLSASAYDFSSAVLGLEIESAGFGSEDIYVVPFNPSTVTGGGMTTTWEEMKRIAAQIHED